jgi:hypothetical protein
MTRRSGVQAEEEEVPGRRGNCGLRPAWSGEGRVREGRPSLTLAGVWIFFSGWQWGGERVLLFGGK